MKYIGAKTNLVCSDHIFKFRNDALKFHKPNFYFTIHDSQNKIISNEVSISYTYQQNEAQIQNPAVVLETARWSQQGFLNCMHAERKHFKNI